MMHTHAQTSHYAIKINAMRCVATNLLIKNEIFLWKLRLDVSIGDVKNYNIVDVSP